MSSPLCVCRYSWIIKNLQCIPFSKTSRHVLHGDILDAESSSSCPFMTEGVDENVGRITDKHELSFTCVRMGSILYEAPACMRSPRALHPYRIRTDTAGRPLSGPIPLSARAQDALRARHRVGSY